MAGPMRWVLFLSVIFFAGLAIYALWVGVSTELMKAAASFAIFAVAGIALYAVGKDAGGET